MNLAGLARRPGGRLVACAVLLLAAAAVAAGLAWTWRAESANLDAADTRLRAEVRALEKASDAPRPAAPARRAVTVRGFSEMLERAARDAGVTIVSVSSTDVPGAADRRPRLEIDAITRGSYPASKRAWAETLDRLPDTVVVHVTLRRTAAGTDIEADWLLSLPACAAGASPDCQR